MRNRCPVLDLKKLPLLLGQRLVVLHLKRDRGNFRTESFDQFGFSGFRILNGDVAVIGRSLDKISSTKEA